MRILCCIKSFALVIFPFRVSTATILYNYNMLTYTSTTYAQIRFQITKSWASASNAFTLNLGYLLALCHWEINKCLLLSDDADITWQTPSCTQWCRDRNELHILIHPKTNFSYHSGTQRLSYHGYKRQDHPMKSSVTHSVTNSHTHTYTTQNNREAGSGWRSQFKVSAAPSADSCWDTGGFLPLNHFNVSRSLLKHNLSGISCDSLSWESSRSNCM